MSGKLYYGDNLAVLREYVRDESVDLVYLDPPFNSNATYNVLFKSPTGRKADAQIQAFEDTWTWGEEAEAAFQDVLRSGSHAAGLLRALRQFMGENNMMAYLAMMAVRLIEMHRVLKDTGSMYLHCDPTASHYLKILLDGIFGADQCRSEIIWLRSKNPKGSQHAAVRYGPATDSIFFYGRSSKAKLDLEAIRLPLSPAGLLEKYDREDTLGRWLDGPVLCSSSMGPRPQLVYEYNGFTPGPSGWRMKRSSLEALDRAGNLYWTTNGQPRRKFRPKDDRGDPVGSFWGDIPPVNSQAIERIGYPTQKPLALLERIIQASSSPGDIVLDPFCGCGTAIHAAQRNDRSWIGIDITHLAIQVIEDRLRHHFPQLKVTVVGRPTDIEGARDLAARDKYQFQWWATWLAGGAPRGGQKKGADRGVDGDLYFQAGKNQPAHAVISVKGGQKLGPQFVRDLKGVRERENADLGLFICLEEPTEEMKREAASSGYFETPHMLLPRIQILTIKELLESGAAIRAPTYDTVTAAHAARRKKGGKTPRAPSPEQREMLLPLPTLDHSATTGLEEIPQAIHAGPRLQIPQYLRGRLKVAV